MLILCAIILEILFADSILKQIHSGRNGHSKNQRLFFQVDGPYAAVKFPPKESGPQGTAGSEVSGNDEATALLQDVRLLRKDELQVCFQICSPSVERMLIWC